MKLVRDIDFDLRPWQHEAFEIIMKEYNAGNQCVLIQATPGAGKTKLGLRSAHYFLHKNICERVVIVTPSENLKKQWAEEAKLYAGLEIDPEFTNGQGIELYDYIGISVTYALLGQDKRKVHAQNTFHKKTIIILDEIHHAGESLTWGNAVKESFQDAVFIVALTGTAFRMDDNPIPFVKYDNNNTSIADYVYTYDRAIKENVCRPVYFSTYEGQMKWKVGSQEFEHSFSDSLLPDQVSKRLKTALDPKGNWIRDVLKAADVKLSDIRRSHINAAGLISAATQKHAQEIAKVVNEVTGTMPPIVISDEGDGAEKINSFKNSNDRWLVSVKMVSEGVDIPRLRVGAYFTIIKSELYFRQFVGRFVRVLRDLGSQDAFVFIPQDRDIVKLAEMIQEERDHALDEAERRSSRDKNNEDEKDLFGQDYIPALTGKFIPLQSEATDSSTISISVGVSNKKHRGIYINPEELPMFEKKRAVKDRCNELAKKIALMARGNNKNIKPDWEYAHKQYIKQGGKKMDQESLDELNNRVKFYERLIQQFRQMSPYSFPTNQSVLTK